MASHNTRSFARGGLAILALAVAGSGCPGQLDQDLNPRGRDNGAPGPSDIANPLLPPPAPVITPSGPTTPGPTPLQPGNVTPPPPGPTPLPPPMPSASCADPATQAFPILQEKCGNLCHNPTLLSGSLDLLSPGAKARLLNISSRICQGKILITEGAAGVGGHLFDKIAGTPVPDCPGTRMPPIGGSLTAAEVKCLKDWIRPSP